MTTHAHTNTSTIQWVKIELASLVKNSCIATLRPKKLQTQLQNFTYLTTADLKRGRGRGEGAGRRGEGAGGRGEGVVLIPRTLPPISATVTEGESMHVRSKLDRIRPRFFWSVPRANANRLSSGNENDGQKSLGR